jgi:hypothetical protein
MAQPVEPLSNGCTNGRANGRATARQTRRLKICPPPAVEFAICPGAAVATAIYAGVTSVCPTAVAPGAFKLAQATALVLEA